MITYYLLIFFLSGMIQSSCYWPISYEIGRGELTKYLLRPVSYTLYHFSLNTARRLTRVFILSLLILTLKFFLPEIFVLPSLFLLISFFVSLFFGFIIYFLFSSLMGFSAFWLIRTVGLIYSLEMVVMFLSGLFVPLDLLPDAFNKVASFFPFKYGLYFSVKIFLSDFTASQILQGLFMQIFWIFILLIFLQWLWNKGLKAYESVGI